MSGKDDGIAPYFFIFLPLYVYAYARKSESFIKAMIWKEMHNGYDRLIYSHAHKRAISQQ
jgi:hypothetical protein